MNDLPAPVEAFLDATNAGDVERFVEAFSPDGVIDDWGRTFTGRDEVRRWTEAESIGVAQTVEVTSFRVEGRRIVALADVGGDGFTGRSTFTFDLTEDGSAIERMTISA